MDEHSAQVMEDSVSQATTQQATQDQAALHTQATQVQAALHPQATEVQAAPQCSKMTPEEIKALAPSLGNIQFTDSYSQNLETLTKSLLKKIVRDNKPTDNKAIDEGLSSQESKHFNELAMHLAKGTNFKNSSPLGQQFQRYLDTNPVAKADYEKSATLGAGEKNKYKAKIRAEWGAMKHAELSAKKKTYSKSWREVEESAGTYYSFSRVVKEEGGRPTQRTSLLPGNTARRQ